MRFLYAFVIFLSFFHISLAQTVNLDALELRINPENPRPETQVNFSLESYVTDLNKANITWLVDGKSELQGIGKNTFSTFSPMNGKIKNVSIVVVSVDGKTYRKSHVIRSNDISIAVEPISSVPPLYRGMPEFSYMSQVKLVAMPEFYNSAGLRIDPKTMIYTWKNGSNVLGKDSGFAKQSLVLTGDILFKQLDIEVLAQTRDGSLKASTFISIEPGSQEILFYEEDPLYGILYNRALTGQKKLTEQEIKVVGIPFFFSNTTDKIWSINNQQIPDLSGQSSIVLRSTGDKEGSTKIGYEIKNSKQILQTAKNVLEVYFSKTPQEQFIEL